MHLGSQGSRGGWFGGGLNKLHPLLAVDCREVLRNFYVALALVIFRQAAEVPESEVHGGMKLLARLPPAAPPNETSGFAPRGRGRRQTGSQVRSTLSISGVFAQMPSGCPPLPDLKGTSLPDQFRFNLGAVVLTRVPVI
jgi:hypothetical protein